MAANPDIKRANVKEKFTPHQHAELIKCKKDPFYFIETYCKVVHPKTHKDVPFKLYSYQRELLESVHENQYSIALFARQMGKCFFVSEKINKDGEEIEIGSLIWNNLTFKQKIITKLEIWKINLILWINKEK